MLNESIQQRAAALRRRAEARAKAMENTQPSVSTPEETDRLLYELRVRQIELEMQNEELIRAQVELAASRARYFGLYHLAPVGYLTLSEKGLILEANLRAASLLGLPSDTLVRRPLARFLLPADSEVLRRCHKQLFRTGEPQVCEVGLPPRRSGAAITWVRLEMELAQDEKEQATVSRVICSDVTERKLAQEALRESEARYRLIFGNAADVIWLLDLAAQRFTYVSPSVFRLRGYTPEEVMTQSIEAVMTPESYQLISQGLPQRLRAFAAGDPAARVQTFEIDQVCKDGSTVPTEVVTTLLTDAAGQVTQVVGVSRDITARKALAAELERHQLHLEELVETRTSELRAQVAERIAAQAALERSEACLRAAERIAHIGTLERDLTTRQIYWTPGLYDIFGIDPATPPDAAQQMARGFIHPDDDIIVQTGIDRALETAQPQEGDYRVILPSGETRMFHGIVVAQRDAAGRPVRLLATAQDITEQKAAGG